MICILLLIYGILAVFLDALAVAVPFPSGNAIADAEAVVVVVFGADTGC